MHSFQSHERDGPPSLQPHHVGWVDVVGMRDQPLFVASGTLHDSGGKKAEAPITPCLILGVGSEPSLQLTFLV
jgi:hypothetical protein